MDIFTQRNNSKFTLLTILCVLFLCKNILAQTGTWTPLTHTPTHYNAGEMLLLTDGTVIAKNSSGTGQGVGWDRLTPDASGSYINGTWTSIASMAKDRLYFSSQVLPSGQVYVCGGEYGTGGKYGEVYNPITNTWTATPGPFPDVVSDANSELLYNGNILQASVDETGVNLNYLWNPTTNTYTAGPNCLRVDNEAVWIKLPDSSVLFLDNYGETSERYMPKTNTWINDATAPVELYDPYGDEAGAGFLLPDGRVFFIGSLPNTLYYTPSGSTSPGTWAAGPAIPSSQGAPDAPAVMMPNGKILLELSPTPTSANHFPSPSQYYEFDYTTNTFTQVGAPGGGTSTANSVYIGNMLQLPDGSVLFCNQGDDQYYEYTPGIGPLTAGQPAISAINRVNCDTFQITGTLFNGITEGAAYGDDWQMSTNYPIVRLTSGANVYYATTYNWNRVGAVMTGTLPDTAIFKLPAGLAAGTYSVTVVANGNPSAPFPINTSLTISPAPVAVCLGDSIMLSDLATIGVWSSANTGIANMDLTTGTVTGVSAGTTLISYSIGACYSTATITVNAPPTAISGAMNVCQGSIVSLSDATAAGIWSSGNTNASVDASGNVTGLVSGPSIISYTLPTTCFITTTVTVNTLPVATITPAGPTTFCTPGSVVLNANTGSGLTYQWQTGGSTIPGATMSSYTATTGGNNTVVVYQNSCSSASLPVTITLDSVYTGPISGSTTVCAGQAIPLTDGTSGGVWSSASAALATVNASGIVTGASGGIAIISYSVTDICGTAVATASVTVGAITSISSIAGTTSVCTGGVTTLSDLTAAGIWSSDNTAVATVNGSGAVTGVATGPADIYYSITNPSGCVSSAAVAVVVSNATFPATITPSGSTIFCSGGYVLLNATTGTGYIYQWQVGGVNISGATTPAYLATTGGNYTAIIRNSSGCVNTSTPITVTVNPGSIVAPSVSISPSLGTIFCTTASPETFSAVPVNGGSSPSYLWYINGSAVAGGPAYTYTPANGDVVECVLSSNATCAFPDTAAGTVAITINPYGNPSVSITSDPAGVVCAGNSVTFSAVPVFGGSFPTYSWSKNGVNVAGSGAQLVYVPNNGDALTVKMTSNYACLGTDTTAASNAYVETVAASALNTLTISVTQPIVIAGQPDTFVAVAPNGGTTPVYQWYINGLAVPGATHDTYITDSIKNGQYVTCSVTSSEPCTTPGTVISSVLAVTVLPSSVPQISNPASTFTLVPNPSKGTFTVSGTLNSSTDEKVLITVTDMLGQAVYSKETIASNGTLNEHIALTGSIANGIYLVNITSGGVHAIFHLVIDK